MESPSSLSAAPPVLSVTALDQWRKALQVLGHALSVPRHGQVIRVRNRIQGSRPTLAQAVAFLCILRSPGQTVGQWCVDAEISSGGACAFLDRFESCGLVERCADPDDGRHIVLQPTAYGQLVGAKMCEALTLPETKL